MNRKQIWKRLPSSLALAVTFVLGTALWHGAFAGPSQQPQPLMLKEQGSFSVGGRVVCAPGTFDPTIPGAGSQNTDRAFALISFYRRTRALRKPELCPLA